ncbi:DUF763 domain-containing protein [Fibrisoma montanum]|uniref:DUF763 domain-containing protein n=1 Tax=Fibrisoma montanum TaxID=2305895 RepID=A0A418MC76_9BACT|nr:DUF763 domain-containing protein [Fibrisoma montanum]RIV23983.1 DUF763 domain-containing protein [Fibrisoma montanum]
MKKSGSADLPLYNGPIPAWLSDRMNALSLGITEAILQEYGSDAFLRRLADPFWFQSFGAVLGMDWNSSGVTTAVMAALKRAINPRSKELGLYVCGGKGKSSLQTPTELLAVGDKTGLDGQQLAYCSRLSAKVDNTAVQDGFQLYLHSFVVNDRGNWSVVQQGMKGDTAMARRYHWHSGQLQSFVEEPHTAVCGISQGTILNLVAKEAKPSQEAMMQIVREHPNKILREANHLVMPTRKDVKASDVDLKRLGAMLWVAQEKAPADFENLLMIQGMGPRTLQSLALVSEVIHGTPSRFSDPARFSFAHGGKGRRPYAVPTHVYDETISTLRTSVEKARLGQSDKQQALKKLSQMAQAAEQDFTPNADAEGSLNQLIKTEKNESWRYGGMSIHGPEQPPNVDAE